MLNKLFSKKECKYCECLVNDYVDKRLNEKRKEEFLAHIENCFIIKNCDHCKKLIEYFSKLKRYCFELRREVTMPENLSKRLFNVINKN
jgi:hypothetical protein